MISSPGFSITEGAKGAEAMTTILKQPLVLQEEQENLKLKQAQARQGAALATITEAKAPYEQDRYKRLLEFTQQSEDLAKESGKRNYDLLSLPEQLKTRELELRAEEQAIKKLAPEDRLHAENTLQRKQKDVDTLRQKMIQEQEKHHGVLFAALNSANSQASLDGTRDYLTRHYQGLADAAIEDGKMDPTNRDAFVQDQMKSIPTKWDEKAAAQIKTMADSMLTTKDLLDLEKVRLQEKRMEAVAQKSLDASKQDRAKADRLLASQDLKELTAHSATVSTRIREIHTSIDDNRFFIDDLKKELLLTPEKIGGFMGMGKEDNPKYVQLTEAIKRREDMVSTLEDEITEQKRIRDTLWEKGKQSGIKIPKEEPKSVTIPKEVQEEFAADPNTKGLSLGKQVEGGWEVIEDGVVIGKYKVDTTKTKSSQEVVSKPVVPESTKTSPQSFEDIFKMVGIDSLENSELKETIKNMDEEKVKEVVLQKRPVSEYKNIYSDVNMKEITDLLFGKGIKQSLSIADSIIFDAWREAMVKFLEKEAAYRSGIRKKIGKESK